MDPDPVEMNTDLKPCLLVVDAGEVAVHHRVVLAQVEGAQVRRHRSKHKRGTAIKMFK